MCMTVGWRCLEQVGMAFRFALNSVRQTHRLHIHRSLSTLAALKTHGHQAVVDSWECNLGRTSNLTGARDDSWWTGIAPTSAACPGLNLSVEGKPYVTALAQPNLASATRQGVREYFDNIWTMTEVLFSSLQGEEPFYRPPYHNLRHPMIFYYAHTASVYVNKMRVAGLIQGPVNPVYEHIFETGVDEMQWDDLSKNHMSWPSVEEVREYRRVVYDLIVDLIENSPEFETMDKLEKSPFWSIVMGTEHEKIHLETSSVLMRELPLNFVRTPEYFPPIHASASLAPPPDYVPQAGVDYPKNEMVDVQGGSIAIGKPRNFPSYGWDNEYGSKNITVSDFKASKYMISNGEFLEFVKSGGYLSKEHWETQGWEWRCYRNTKWPTYWVPVGPSGFHQYRLRTVFEVIDMPWSWPAIVNYHEAKAFANWKSEQEGKQGDRKYHLTTEATHHAMRDASLRNPALGIEQDPSMTCDGPAMLSRGMNLNLGCGSETPVDALLASSTGIHDVMGNAWEWCEDHFSALPGFKVHPYYNDFSIPCFDGEHNIIMGGSFVSCGDEASIFSRFHFRPHFYQHAGFRLVEPNPQNPTLITSCMDNQGPFAGVNPFRSSNASGSNRAYEQTKLVNQFVHLHYNSDKDLYSPPETKNYSKKVADFVKGTADEQGVTLERVLDAGCGPGGVSFELSRHANRVLGLDISKDFIEAARKMKAYGKFDYSLAQQGEVAQHFVAELPSGADANRVEFKQTDILCISPDTGVFDAAVVANVVDRLLAPASLLGRLGGPLGLIKPGGLLFVSTPFSWEEQFTPKELWIGGIVPEGGSAQLGRECLQALLCDQFEFVGETEIPIALRDHERRFEYVSSYMGVFKHVPKNA
eukprot:m.353431 g.353431  ORF g.353431 m.353431 type:complete len:866 (+) comp16765_c0_seq1:400-2997(+)